MSNNYNRYPPHPPHPHTHAGYQGNQPPDRRGAGGMDRGNVHPPAAGYHPPPYGGQAPPSHPPWASYAPPPHQSPRPPPPHQYPHPPRPNVQPPYHGGHGGAQPPRPLGGHGTFAGGPHGPPATGSSGGQQPPSGQPLSYNMPIPRRHPHPPPQAAQTQQAHRARETAAAPTAPPPPPRVSVKSERPFVVRVNVKGVPLNRGGIPPRRHPVQEQDDSAANRHPLATRASARTPKRKRHTYNDDLEDTDSDFSEEELLPTSSSSKERLKKRSGPGPGAKDGADGSDVEGDAIAKGATGAAAASGGGALLAPVADDIYQIEPPPEGVLSTLWYSRECVSHVFVIEKILGWKRRHVVQLNFTSDAAEAEQEHHHQHHAKPKHRALDPVKATAVRDKALTDAQNDCRRRMEISRINPSHCPVVMALAAAKEDAKASRTRTPPEYQVVRSETELEDVFLIKWRGRSHLHCSWERRRDLEKFDHSNNTARGKIQRYVRSQELALGMSWKHVLEEGRRAAATPMTHAHHPHSAMGALKGIGDDDENAETEEEEFFPPVYLEVERILACDESEMDMNVLARQRALNLKAEREALRRREEDAAAAEKAEVKKPTEKGSEALQAKTDKLASQDGSQAKPAGADGVGQAKEEEEEEPWDPEDNVRYVVKWKGLQFSDITWEYWRDIKYDFVDQAEDFWFRQRAPDANETKEILSRRHPHVKEFKKLGESPIFGTTQTKRPVADLDDGFVAAENGDDDIDEAEALKLRSYQLEGVNWLLWNWYNRRSCILADEMGLGKTIQSVGFLDQLQRMPASKVRGPFLVVAPLTLVNQWQSESQAWAPDMNVILYHGSADARKFLVEQEFFYNEQFVPKGTAQKLKRQHITKFHLLITTYEVILKDVAVLSKIRWKALIVDEAHRLKNPKARLFEDLASVPRDFCLLLTGTPLQNSTEELWSLLHFSDPVTFASKEAFVEKFGQLTDSKQVSDLHTVLRPYLLRRVKEDVEKSLPPKEETILEVTLTPIQKTFYKAIYEKNTAFLFKGSKPSNAPSLMNVMMELRKCCNHPFLIRGAEERILADAAAALKDSKSSAPSDEKDGAPAPPPIDYIKLTAEQLVKSSGKMVLLEKLLPKLFDGGHKVLVFSQMVRVLDLLEELLRLKHYRYERLDGSTSASSRAAAVDRFHRKSCQRFVMLLSTRAGGLGLNLTAADTVVIFDSDWNPQNDLQAMARAHRIGQTRAVSVYRLLTSKTYEMHMFHQASLKLGLDRAVLAHQRQSTEGDGGASKSKGKSKVEREQQAKEIDELLKKGAYDVFRDDDDKEAQQFMETDIDQLLERSSRKVTYGNTATTSLSSGLGSFSKASFVASTGDADGKDVDLDDPNFWEKAVGLEAPPEGSSDPNAMLLVEEGKKRSRTKIQQYDPYAEYAEADQKKKDQKALKKKLEKEAKEKARLEKENKKQKKKAKDKDRKKREKEAKGSKEKPTVQVPDRKDIEAEDDAVFARDKKHFKEGKSKKMKKIERRRAIRKAEKEDPILERIKQAWEISQRNRATSATLRFGFGRFCKIRHEANLTSLPIQDLEVFFRGYVYQLGLQASVSVLRCMRDTKKEGSVDHDLGNCVRKLLDPLVGPDGGPDCVWICSAILSALQLHAEVKNQLRFVRMPQILAEPAFLSYLRDGAALRALRRLAFLSRLNRVIEDALDKVLSDLGHEELGKRGCATNDISTLDVDLKARHVSSEELSHALAVHLFGPTSDHSQPASYASVTFLHHAPWWDRSCDLGLLVGTFIHGLGNYEAMKNDQDLPFGFRIKQHVLIDPGAVQASFCFDAASAAARKVFDDALNSAKSKAQAEAHAVVAAAVAASKLAEEKQQIASATKKPLDKDVPSSASSAGAPTPTVSAATPDHNGDPSLDQSSFSVGSVQDDGSDTITLRRLSEAVKRAAPECQPSKSKRDYLPAEDRLPMPDANHLDMLLVKLVSVIEMNSSPSSPSRQHIISQEEPRQNVEGSSQSIISIVSDISINARNLFCHTGAASDTSRRDRSANRTAFTGILCGTFHRTLDDGTDYFLGAASPDLAFVASSADASRYVRGPGVPLIVNRFGLSALVYADTTTVEKIEISEAKAIGLVSSDHPHDDKTAVSESAKSLPDAVSSDSIFLAPLRESGDRTQADEVVGMSIPSFLRDDAHHRASLSVALLYHGYPLSSDQDQYVEVNEILHNAVERMRHRNINNGIGNGPAKIDKKDGLRRSFYSMEDLFNVAGTFVAGNRIPPSESENVELYFQNVFIPHCVRLCLWGHDALHSDARNSSDEELGFNISKSVKKCVGTDTLCPLPDPCLPLSLHSEDAVAHASAILRRVRLARSIRYIVGGGVPVETLMSFLRGSTMRKQMDGLPVWWCPWIHDVGLLVHAALHGLFAIIPDVENPEKMRATQSIFERTAIEHHIRDVFINGFEGKKPALPLSFLRQAKPEELDNWVRHHAVQFLTPNVLERRLSVICAEMTATLGAENPSGDDARLRYDALPMFDHGGWPMNEEPGFDSSGTCANPKNLLRVAET